MRALLVAVALLAAAPGADADRRAAVERELGEVAARIEALKVSGVRGGDEIERLLVRSQVLAAELERLDRAPAAGPAAAAPADPQELRERADALRDEADRLRGALGRVEARLRVERRRGELDRRLESLAGAGSLFDESAPGRYTARSGGPEGRSPEPSPTSGDAAPSPPAGSGGAIPDTASPPPGGATAGTGGSPPPAGPTAGTGGAPPPAAPTAAGTDDAPSAGAVYLPERRWEGLDPAPRDSAPDLRRKRDELRRVLGEVERRIETIEAEARDLDRAP